MNIKRQDALTEAVLDQIQQDVDMGDFTAIEELVRNVPTELLMGYLSEETANQIRG